MFVHPCCFHAFKSFAVEGLKLTIPHLELTSIDSLRLYVLIWTSSPARHFIYVLAFCDVADTHETVQSCGTVGSGKCAVSVSDNTVIEKHSAHVISYKSKWGDFASPRHHNAHIYGQDHIALSYLITQILIYCSVFSPTQKRYIWLYFLSFVIKTIEI